ncbi:bifunctional diguanylate cyclase/phosphodiesterase [Acidocella sp. KAb 2-4]|uniref:putative bifunctional diguanylate cyclase/phosphodiesterase n=1 Tax=Acidocella sp. KAb 2-4 TaxID=2885158 RepID=UPI001D094A53|nr:bifunctional diguanylate cyclase/phosphodiesterase [Acidocella sp. KAb 2-4]MCB5945248.1 bifunctional diguanylate cyclase/phosphodiesterase [Acidocella sp. KAb 2-4]
MISRATLPAGRQDPITGLPNRRAFTAAYQPLPGAQLVMLTLADPKHFDRLLGAIGHEHAETFIRDAATRLRAVLAGSVEIYHISPLNYAFVMPFGAPPDMLQTLLDAFNQPLTCGVIPISADIALGVADCHDADAASVLRAGLCAARDCRDSGRGWARYNRKTDSAHQRSFMLLSDLCAAIRADDQLHLHFQPKYDLGTGETSSAEALLRWRHPVFGNISPAEFVPLAETTAQIHQLTEWVLRHAIAQAGAWAAKGLRLNTAINVSPRNLTRRGFSTQVGKLLSCYGVDPSRIELEFTEGVLVSNDPVVLDELRALRATGMRIALDDFGTGFANFSYITHLPADIIKIDKSFIQRICSDPRSATVVRALIELAHKLDYSVVAEGIESKRAYVMLREWRCNEGQGYFMSPPVDPAAMAARISQRETETVP